MAKQYTEEFPPDPDEKQDSKPPRPNRVPRRKKQRGFLTELLVRFMWFFFLIFRVLFISAFVFALTAAAGYLIVERYVRSTEISVPALAGYKLDDALKLLMASGADLSLRIDKYDISNLVDQNEIISQLPVPGTRAKQGTVIRVVVSKGSSSLACPDFRGKPYLEAGIALRKAEFREGNKSYIFSAQYRKDQVIGQDPAPGSKMERNSPVNLLISLGQESAMLLMPDLINLSVSQAQDKLRQINMKIDHQSEQPLKGKDNGLICEQNPPAGSNIAPDAQISITVVNNIGF